MNFAASRKIILLMILVVLCVFTSCAKQESFRITFVIDKDYDRQMIFNMFQGNDPSGLESRAKRMQFNLDFAKKIKQANNYESIKKELEPFVDNVYKKEMVSLKKSQKEYTKSWKPIVGQFSKEVIDFTGHPWFYDKYLCVVSPFHPGISNWYGNKIIRKYNEDPIKQRWITAYEIILSHIFHVVRESYTKEELSDWQVWAFSEITTVFISTDPKMIKPFWPLLTIRENYFSNSNYPQLAGLENKLKKIWINRKDFGDYLSRSVPVLAKFTNTHKTS